MSKCRVEPATIFANASQVVTCAGPGRARRGSEMRDAGVRTGVAVAVLDGRVADVAPLAELRSQFADAREIDCGGGVLTPGLVDSHTHGIFGRPRFEEQEMRAAGLDYMEIARRGGGIHASVRGLRALDEETLIALARPRLMRLAAFGTTTVEVKSGYGLTLDDELKTLRVIARLARELPIRIVPTFLGAHEIPLEHRESSAARRAYVEALIHEMIPAVAARGLARFADVFCETGVYTVEESREILTAARAAGLELKLHADELTSAGGAELAASLNATSADHLAAISDDGIAALAGADTVATVLPGTMLFLGKSGHAPARRLIEAGVPLALATDFNPGTSPTPNLPLILALGVSQLRLSVAEVVIGATVNGAAALAMADRLGQIARGYSADLALYDIRDVRELPYWYGDNRCVATFVAGKPCDESNLAVS
ncbi:MAG TPA: imidazolonepropionase [Gemmatimonadaceae bacterium]|nr:imidazolonepropionase [Gemmatimonadaceae bacterium]